LGLFPGRSIFEFLGQITILAPVRFETGFSRQGSKSRIVRFKNVSFVIDIDKLPQMCIQSVKIVGSVIDIDKIP